MNCVIMSPYIEDARRQKTCKSFLGFLRVLQSETLRQGIARAHFAYYQQTSKRNPLSKRHRKIFLQVFRRARIFLYRGRVPGPEVGQPITVGSPPQPPVSESRRDLQVFRSALIPFAFGHSFGEKA